MKKYLTLLAGLLLLTSAITSAQTDSDIARTSYPIEMLFPLGRAKALILSYDDGRPDDRQLVALMNKYKLVGTFHLNSNKLGTKDYLTREEIKTLFQGHEVSVHSADHPSLSSLSKTDIVYQVAEDRKALEKLVGYPVRGMAYPFGDNNELVVDAVKGLGIEYARTVDDTYNFNIPTNFLRWHPSVHQFAHAYFEKDNPENDKKELEKFYQLISDFVNTRELAVLDVWGHSWELGGTQPKWEETEKFFKMVANNPFIYYTSQIDLVDYINAWRNLKFSVDKNMVKNLSSLKLYFRYRGRIYTVLPGEMLVMKE